MMRAIKFMYYYLEIINSKYQLVFKNQFTKTQVSNMRVTRSKRNLFDQPSTLSLNKLDKSVEESKFQYSFRDKRDVRRRNKFQTRSLTELKTEQTAIKEKLLQMNANPTLMTHNNYLLTIKNHIKPDGHILRPITLTGVNLLSEGFTHVMWAHLLKQQDRTLFQKVKHSYYEDYMHTIKSGLKQFQNAFGDCVEKFGMDAESTQLFSSIQVQNAIQITDEPESNIQIIQAEQEISKIEYSATLKQLPVDTSQNQIFIQFSQRQSKDSILISPTRPSINQNDSYLGLNLKFLRQRIMNERRLAAEMTCRFFNIPTERTFWPSQIQVETVLESHSSKQMQYLIVLAKVKSSESNSKENHLNQSQVFISCYRCLKLEQLVRVQMACGPIFGFIVCDIDNYLVDCLTKIQINNRNQST